MFDTRQKPIESVGVAWWPGGRTAQNAAVPSPRRSAATAVKPAPAASAAADDDCALVAVSASIHPPPAAAQVLEAVQVPRRMHQLQIGTRGRLRFEGGDGLGEHRVARRGGDGGEARRPFWMVSPGLMLEVQGMGREEHRHRPPTLEPWSMAPVPWEVA